jgi:hypothetical protein
VILFDANVLLYAVDASSPRHGRARDWVEGALSGETTVGFPLASLLAFVRISTDPRVFDRPLDTGEALAIVQEWVDRPVTQVVEPGRRHWEVFAGLCERGRARGPLTADAHLAALAVEHGATLVTTDRDFARFDGVDVLDPTS